VFAKGSDHADSPSAPDAPDGLRVTPPALLALVRLLGRLAAIEAQETNADQEWER
jgi:hypothetical protein